jgi:hypothetical protein
VLVDEQYLDVVGCGALAVFEKTSKGHNSPENRR